MVTFLALLLVLVVYGTLYVTGFRWKDSPVGRRVWPWFEKPVVWLKRFCFDG